MEVDLIEAGLENKLIGKEVIDSEARRIGFVCGVRLRYPPLRVFLLVQGQSYTFEVPFDDISGISDNFVQLSKPYPTTLAGQSLSSLKVARVKDMLLSIILKELPLFLREFKDGYLKD